MTFSPTKVKALGSVATFAAGNAASSLATYVLFLVFAYRSSGEVLGTFSLISAGVGILVVVVDTLITQRVVQDTHARGALIDETTSVLSSLAPTRLGLTLVLALTGSVLLGCLSGDLVLSAATFVLAAGQATYSIVSTTQSLVATKFVSIQILFTVAGLLASAWFWFGISNASTAGLLLAMGASRIVPGGSLLLYDSRRQSRRRVPRSELRRILVGSSTRAKSAALLVLHIANAITGNADTMIAGIGGVALVGHYQLAQRPMLGLSVLNVSIGQTALKRFVGAKYQLNGWYLALFSSVLVVWPCLGVVAGVIVNQISPPSVQIPDSVFVVLGLGFGFGAIAAVTGPLLLIRGEEFALMTAGVVQLVVLILFGLLLVGPMQLTGIAISFAVSKFSVVAIQLVSLDRAGRVGRRALGSSV
ncbi:hypothetical protein [Cryobacterium sp. 10I5]|uniref:hypothetical protein n=1 Tax=Cryobacterium sp. 10I5 TaxID=3048581 RepID=UPI002B22ECCC|nr:hypothetical protein [Cryobacterium sp. 10I5]MEB0265473.1 hypothetical protein [Cryobacterium sp. 10I5]